MDNPIDISKLANDQLGAITKLTSTLTSISSKAQKGANMLSSSTSIPKGGGIGAGVSAMNTIMTSVSTISQTISTQLQSVVKGALGSAQNMIDGAVSDVMGTVQSSISSASDTLMSTASDAIASVKDMGTSALDNVKFDGVSAISDKVSNMVTTNGFNVSLDSSRLSDVTSKMGIDPQEIVNKAKDKVPNIANPSTLETLKEKARMEDLLEEK